MPLKVSDVIRMLERDGWRLSRTRGSHRQFRHPTKPGTVAVADTQDECVTLMREAIAFHLEGLQAEGEPLPHPATVAATVVTTDAA